MAEIIGAEEKKMTAEQEARAKDIAVRSEKFNKELMDLQKKYQLGLSTQTQLGEMTIIVPLKIVDTKHVGK